MNRVYVEATVPRADLDDESAVKAAVNGLRDALQARAVGLGRRLVGEPVLEAHAPDPLSTDVTLTAHSDSEPL